MLRLLAVSGAVGTAAATGLGAAKIFSLPADERDAGVEVCGDGCG